MDEIELAFALAFVLGVASGYALRAAISALKRQKVCRLRDTRARAEIEAARSSPLKISEARPVARRKSPSDDRLKLRLVKGGPSNSGRHVQ